MKPALTEEMRKAIRQEPTGVATVEDADTHEEFIIIPQAEYRRLLEADERFKFQHAFEQADRGEFVDWNPEAVKAEARRRMLNPEE